MYDYQIVCFNGANRSENTEMTDAMAIHPITKECKEFLEKFCKENGIICMGGVAFGKDFLMNLTDALEYAGFKECWTMFTNGYIDELNHLKKTGYDWLEISENSHSMAL